MVPDRDTIEYIEWLIKKATPEHDSPMVVDWVPHVKYLLYLVSELRLEYGRLKEDYERLRTERMKGIWSAK